MDISLDEKYRVISDTLSPIEIAGLYLGLLTLLDDILDDPHPRKHNVSGRAGAADLYHRRLSEELQYHLAQRDPARAAAIADELLRSQREPLRRLGRSLRDQYPSA